MTEIRSHTVVALVTLIGGFSLLIISQATGRPLADGVMTLVTLLMGSVTGFFFGTRGALSGVAAAAAMSPPPAPAAEAAPAPAPGGAGPAAGTTAGSPPAPRAE